MEKKNIKEKITKVFKIVLVVSYTILLFTLIGLEIWTKISIANISFSSLIFWMILVGWISIIAEYKWKSGISIFYAIVLYIFGCLLSIFGLVSLSEAIFRVSFIGFLIGIVQALGEYSKKNVKK